MNIQDYYKYSLFSTLAYVDWRSISKTDYQSAIIDAANAKRVPGSVSTSAVDTLGEKIFSPTTDGGEGWSVSDFHPNDPSTKLKKLKGSASHYFLSHHVTSHG